MSHQATADRDVSIEPLGESTLLLRFGEGLDSVVNARVHAASAMLHAAHLPGIVDIVPAYATLGLHYEPSAWIDGHGGSPALHITAAVRAIFREPPTDLHGETATIEIPVCYGGEFGADLQTLATHAALTIDEVIARHTAGTYRVAMLGFAPGFPYFFGLDPSLHMPRRASPRTRVPAGSVAIGGAQTGIYPSELPGGWQIIGRSPAVLFDVKRDPPSLLMPGDTVRFVRIDAKQFAEQAPL
ncbi:MAG TPA: 5-oxoprolinase subunit PxpB [Rhodanobacteraceae bacterium]|jgi:KipI family sensor histidine kinase inhibitor|nr:5-oxoprolinase subunit PxpB [Rhodanobacteraceae bacterium]